MVSKRYVEMGRVARINYGEDYGKLVVIVDVLDQNWALVDSPDMVCCKMNFKRLSLTDIKIDIKRAPKKEELFAAMEAADVKNKLGNRKLTVQMKRRYQILIRCPDQKHTAKSVLAPSSNITLRDLVVSAFPDSGKKLSLMSFNLNGRIVDGASKMSQVKITPLSTLNLTLRLLGGGKDGASTSTEGSLERLAGLSVVDSQDVVNGTELPGSSVVDSLDVVNGTELPGSSDNGTEGLPRFSRVGFRGPRVPDGVDKYVVTTPYGDQVVTVIRPAADRVDGKRLLPQISIRPSPAFAAMLRK